MQVFEIDGNNIKSLDDFESQFSSLPFVPGWYGQNLNALWDVLTGVIERPIKLVWRNADQSQRAMRHDFASVVDVMREAQSATASSPEKFELELISSLGVKI